MTDLTHSQRTVSCVSKDVLTGRPVVTLHVAKFIFLVVPEKPLHISFIGIQREGVNINAERIRGEHPPLEVYPGGCSRGCPWRKPIRERGENENRDYVNMTL